MPELLEVEAYRSAVDAVVGRLIRSVVASDAAYLRGGIDPGRLVDALVGQRIEAASRLGKVLLVHTTGPVLGLRFGMTGVVEVDGFRPIDALAYGPRRDDPAWERFAVVAGAGGLRVVDPRRFGSVELDPDLTALGPDASCVRPAQLTSALADRRAPVKACLLDQHVVAGLGNLLVDDILWRAGVAPWRPGGTLDADEVAVLRRSIRTSLRVLGRRGGSHTGDLQPARRAGGSCPRDGEPLRRDTVGGRTTWWCPRHQR